MVDYFEYDAGNLETEENDNPLENGARNRDMTVHGCLVYVIKIKEDMFLIE